jgi:hypothetical protein
VGQASRDEGWHVPRSDPTVDLKVLLKIIWIERGGPRIITDASKVGSDTRLSNKLSIEKSLLREKTFEGLC